MKHAEIFLAQTEQSGAIDFGIAADPVASTGMQIVTFFVGPDIFGVIAVIEKYSVGIPVRLFLRQESAALENKHSFTSIGQMVCQRSAARARADDNRFIPFSGYHASSLTAAVFGPIEIGCRPKIRSSSQSLRIRAFCPVPGILAR